MSEILDSIFIWVFLVNSESVLLLPFVKYMFFSHCTQKMYFFYFLEAKKPFLWRKSVQNLFICVYLFCPKNSRFDFRKTFKTQEYLFVESCPTPRWITFLNLYRLVLNISYQWINFGLKCLSKGNQTMKFG